MAMMVQQTTIDAEPREKDDSALVLCKKCKHLVPRTMLCLYCGSPIEFKMPQNAAK